MNVEKVLLAAPRGFCAGVEMAIKALAWMVRAFEPPVYCYHEIVHNRLVVDRFRDLGVVFVDDIADVPDGAPLMLSAHGSAPEVVAAARANGGFVVDAVCPLVTKVHHEVKVRAGKGYSIVYVGHEGHDEAVGTMAVAPGAIHLVETDDDVAALDDVDGPVALLAQTTLSHHDWAGVLAATRERFPDLWVPGPQRPVLRHDQPPVGPHRDRPPRRRHRRHRLGELVQHRRAREGRPAPPGARAYRVNGADELPDDLEGTVGVTAGASAPEELVRAVIDRLDPANGVEVVTVTDEDEYFPPPRELRELLGALDTAVRATLAAAVPATTAFADDRQVVASDVLDALAPQRRRMTP